MLDAIMQQFASGQAGDLPHDQAASHVGTMVQQAPQEHVFGAVSDALGGMDSGTFGSSVASAASSLGTEQRGQLGSLLLGALGSGGGAGGSVLHNLGISSVDPSQFSPSDLGTLASHLHQNNLPGLTGVLGNALGAGNLGGAGGGGLGGGSGAGVLSLLGNPVVRQVGTQLAQRLMGS
ncbi:MAG: hypothetical protein NVSMB65_09260 [Chloroflexota bacterium]